MQSRQVLQWLKVTGEGEREWETEKTRRRGNTHWVTKKDGECIGATERDLSGQRTRDTQNEEDPEE